jgi:uncharacterized membrane protein YgcG
MASKTLTGLMALSTLLAAAVPNQHRAQATQGLPLPAEVPEDRGLSDSVIITADASAIEYLVACQTASAQPDSCDGSYTGVRVTQGHKTMDANGDGAVTTETNTIVRDQWTQVAVAAESTLILDFEMRAPKGNSHGGGVGRKSSGGSRSGKGGSSGKTSNDCDSDNENGECNTGARVKRAGLGVAVAAIGFVAWM